MTKNWWDRLQVSACSCTHTHTHTNKHTPYDAVQTVDLLVGVAGGSLLLYKWCRDQSFGRLRKVGYQTSDWVAANGPYVCWAWMKSREERKIETLDDCWQIFDVIVNQWPSKFKHLLLSLSFTCAGVFSRRWPVTGLDKHLLSVSLDHVNIFADLLERHLEK